MSAKQRENLMTYLRACEASPEKWWSGALEIPLAHIDMTWDEADELFGLPSLPEVRTAIEEWCADDQAGRQPTGATA